MAQNSDFSNESSSTQLISDDLYKADQKAGFSLHLFISVKEAIHSSSLKNNYDIFCWPGKFL